jgi:predicted MarR family transcription regulator
MMRKNWVVESGSTPGHLKVVGTCSVSGEEHSIEVPSEGFTRWQSGTLIQVALPDLSPDDREFLMSGITPAAWDRIFN